MARNLSFMRAFLESSAKFRTLNQHGSRKDTTVLTIQTYGSPFILDISLTSLLQRHRKFQKAVRKFFDEVVLPDAVVNWSFSFIAFKLFTLTGRTARQTESGLHKVSLTK